MWIFSKIRYLYYYTFSRFSAPGFSNKYFEIDKRLILTYNVLTGGKLKTWRKRWFVLKNGILTYYKSQNDVNRKPQGQIVLDENCKITRAEGSNTFEIDTGKKTYYLTADSITAMEDWVKIYNLKSTLSNSNLGHKPVIFFYFRLEFCRMCNEEMQQNYY